MNDATDATREFYAFNSTKLNILSCGQSVYCKLTHFIAEICAVTVFIGLRREYSLKFMQFGEWLMLERWWNNGVDGLFQIQIDLD